MSRIQHILRSGYIHSALILLCLHLPSGGVSQNKNPEANLVVPCAAFRSGTYDYTTRDREGIRVVRRGKKQTETNKVNGCVSYYKVKWTDDCVMQLTFLKSTKPTRESQLAKGGRQVVIMDTILITAEDFYEFKSTRFGVKNYGAARRYLTPAEIAEKERKAMEKAMADSLKVQRAAQAITDSLRRDSVNKAKAAENVEKEKNLREEAAARKKQEEENKSEGNAAPAATGEKPPKEKKEKKEKPPKEKKEKPPKKEKEKKEKPEKEKKEK